MECFNIIKRDQNNEQVITRLGEETLKEIAKTANGEYIDGSKYQSSC